MSEGWVITRVREDGRWLDRPPHPPCQKEGKEREGERGRNGVSKGG